ncbi:uncharacterized protein ACLA_034550 [Aspergillus clavatus NRRL 1]|uniref:Uncharacterized protein n=1 Tax=Aspergillus clavatus (strain ATCC 1007 / CBS 513.65 / DSM 816 / NCTC 3887 / NRRL 1 / QM 1276 / 107) TaxID=344612 RepID=A1CJC8_ASPCL|nr:uncharacterized protein ACLA_034550 [Aspergillus clavatus NRRL 1]EAW09252.1 hypothetical protein ACLA_034550 [Aspergillus clavatus NRRL 1]
MSSNNKTYMSNGEVLSSPPLPVRISRFFENIYFFLGLYFVTLFSFMGGAVSREIRRPACANLPHFTDAQSNSSWTHTLLLNLHSSMSPRLQIVTVLGLGGEAGVARAREELVVAAVDLEGLGLAESEG